MQPSAARSHRRMGTWGRRARRLGGQCLLGLLVLVALGLPGTARAQEKSKRAKELFDAALALMDGGNAAQACPLLEQSQKLDPGMGTQYYLGRCYEKTGRLGSAYNVFDDVAQAAKKAGQPERESVASQAAAALASRVPRLRIVVPSKVADLAGLRIDRDGTKVFRAFWGHDVPVDLGEHTVTAKANGKATWERKVLLTQEGVTVKIEVPVLGTPDAEGAARIETEPGKVESKPAGSALGGGPAAGAGAPADGSSSGAPPDAKRPAEGDSAGGWPVQRYFAIGAGAIGVAGIVVGAVFAAQASSKWSDAKSHCVNEDLSLCDTEAASLQQDASTAANVSTAGFVVGGVGLAAAAVLVATDPAFWADDAKSTKARVRVTPAASGAMAGLSLVGSF